MKFYDVQVRIDVNQVHTKNEGELIYSDHCLVNNGRGEYSMEFKAPISFIDRNGCLYPTVTSFMKVIGGIKANEIYQARVSIVGCDFFISEFYIIFDDDLDYSTRDDFDSAYNVLKAQIK